MTNKKSTIIKACAVLLAGSLLASVASARDFAHRTALHNRSLFQGVGKTELPLLRREPGPGRTAMLGKVYNTLRSRGVIASAIVEEESDQHKQGLKGAAWRLTAHEDGTRIRFRDRTAVENNHARGRKFLVEQRLTNEDLEVRGRAVVQQHLSDIVVLGPKEAMVALFTEHEIDHAHPLNGAVIPDNLVASTIVFGRTIDGVDVIGPGSKVAVMFSADGQLIGFDAEWPQYKPQARRQRLHAASALRERASALGTMKAGGDVVELDRFECGYIDLGGNRHRRDPNALIQAGCAARYWSRKGVGPNPAAAAADGQGELNAINDFIPAGIDVVADRGWPSAMAVCQGGDECRASELGRALMSAQPPTQPKQ